MCYTLIRTFGRVFMRRNGMCPLCYIKKLFTKTAKLSQLMPENRFDNGVAHTPPMGWSSWNTFKNKINQDLILETATIMANSGLLDAGYKYVNLDDNWHSSVRDENGHLQGDLSTFSRGIPDLVQKINALGLKVGIYSSNGTHTCEDLPASLYHEREDALTFAKWGIEYFKYDFCHNIQISPYAPLVYSIDITSLDGAYHKEYYCTEASLAGLAKLMPDKKVPAEYHVSGLCANGGSMTYNNITCPEDGEYILTINLRKFNKRDVKFIVAEINNDAVYEYDIPTQKHYNYTARYQNKVRLNKGTNIVTLINPIATRADSSRWQYTHMSNMLVEATKTIALESQKPEKPIVYSVCEWGKNSPATWAPSCSNLWRTTPDIRPVWRWMMIIYNINVKKYKYSGVGTWNDPDMLEVGNGKLTYDENVSHFSLWCMMASPLILGNDLRKMSKNVLDIVTNKALIAIDQDPLGKSAKRIKKGGVDILARPLADGSVALMFLNKKASNVNVSFNLSDLVKEDYVNLARQNHYTVTDIWTATTQNNLAQINITLARHASKVFIISK